jgi:hypothetical protein
MSIIFLMNSSSTPWFLFLTKGCTCEINSFRIDMISIHYFQRPLFSLRIGHPWPDFQAWFQTCRQLGLRYITMTTERTEIERQHIIIIRINMSKWKRETISTQQIHRVSLVLMTGKINNTTQLISQHTKNIQAWYGHFNNNMEWINNGQYPLFLLNLSGHGSAFHVWVKCQHSHVTGRTFTTKEMISISPLWTFHLYVAIFQQHLHMEFISLSWYDIPEFVVPIRISLLESCC